jgi:hypothetical protein
MKKKEKIKRLKKEKEALLSFLPYPGLGSGDSPVKYESRRKVDEDGNISLLEWHADKGWSIQIEQAGKAKEG